MDLTVTPRPFNLLEEQWIPVLYANGKTERIGIWQALTDAGKIRLIATSNPMDRVSLLRFLLAVLMWCKEDTKAALAALSKESAGIPENWLAKLKKYRDAFNLLGDGKRFYQDESLKDKDERPIGDLLVEFPGADSINHMRHVHQDSYGFCPACCVLGILRLSVWAPANRFYPASVNPGSAAYAFIEGKNLFQTFYANLPETNTQTDQAPWLEREQPNVPDAVARLAWRPRKLWLNIAENSGLCAYCGQPGTLIKSLFIEKGWPTPITTGQQFGKNVLSEFQKLSDDYKSKASDKRKLAEKVVKIAPVILKCRMPVLSQTDSNSEQAFEDKSIEAKIARVFDQLYAAGNQVMIDELIGKPSKEEKSLLEQEDTQGKKFWLEDPHLLKQDEPIGLPDLNADVALHSSKFWRDAMRLRETKAVAIGIVGDGQYIFHDAPAVFLSDVSDDVKRRVDLSADCSAELRAMIKQVTQNPKRLHPEIESLVKLLTPNAEAEIRDQLKQLTASVVYNETDYKIFLRAIYTPVVEQVIATVTTGSPLSRRDAKNKVHRLLNNKIKELLDDLNQPSVVGMSEPATVKPQHDLKKGAKI